jgi:hypothetical protein
VLARRVHASSATIFLLLGGIAVAGFLFGALRSLARYRGRRSFGSIELGAPVIGFGLTILAALLWWESALPTFLHRRASATTAVTIASDVGVVPVPGNNQAASLEVAVHVTSTSNTFRVRLEYATQMIGGSNNSSILRILSSDGSILDCTHYSFSFNGHFNWPCPYGTMNKGGAFTFADNFIITGLEPGEYIFRASNYLGGASQSIQRVFMGVRNLAVEQIR